MSNVSDHCLADAILLRAMDEELPRRQAWLAKLHLESCESCQARLEELRLVSSGVAELHQIAMLPEVTARFAAQLEEEQSRQRNTAWWRWFARPLPTWRQLAWCGAIGVVILAGLTLRTTRLGAPAPRILRPVPPASAFPARQHLVAEIPGQPVRRSRHTVTKHAPREPFSSPARTGVREVATQFFDLPFSDAALPLDQATVIRVELPRSALELAGLPVDEDRRNQRIRADLVLGADGLARAIRFVQ